MHEIKAIASLTRPKDLGPPLQQPKTGDSFTSLLDELLGNLPGVGTGIEPGASGSGQAQPQDPATEVPLPAADKPKIPVEFGIQDSAVTFLGGNTAVLAAGQVNPLNVAPPDLRLPEAKPGSLSLDPPEPAPNPDSNLPIVPTLELPKLPAASGDLAPPATGGNKATDVLKSAGPSTSEGLNDGPSRPVRPGMAPVVPVQDSAKPAEWNPLNSPVPEINATPLELKPPSIPAQAPAVPTASEAIPPAGREADLPSKIQAGTARTGVGLWKPAVPAKDALPALDQSRDSPSIPVEISAHLMAFQVHHAAFCEPRPASIVLTPESPARTAVNPAAKQIPERLNLNDFDVTRFEYKTEVESPRIPELQMSQVLQMVRTSAPVREIKPLKLAGADADSLARDASLQSETANQPAMIARPEAVEHVRLVFEPPPPPPVARSVSMDIGDAESQVRVVIRERNGSLNVQFGSANERLRQDLQTSGPLLMRELQRNNPMAVTLDFSNFGSATDADRQPRPQSQAKKFLKPDAKFADAVETAYLPTPASTLKSL